MSEAITHRIPIKHRLDKHIADVLISSPADGEVLTYELATLLWKNKAPTGGVGDHYAMFLDYPFCQLWYANVNVVGSVTQRGFRADVYTSAAILTSRVYTSVGVLIASKEPKFQAEFAISPVLISGTIVTVGLTYSSDPRLESGSIGLEYEYPTLYAFSSDGTTRSRLALTFTMDVQYHIYRQILQSGVGLRTWIDGVEKETKTTNLPTTQQIGTWNCQIIGTSSGLYLYVMYPRIIWKP